MNENCFSVGKTKNIEFYYVKYYPEISFKFLNIFAILKNQAWQKMRHKYAAYCCLKIVFTRSIYGHIIFENNKNFFSCTQDFDFFQFSENFLKTAEISARSDFQVHRCAICVLLRTSIFCKHPQKFAKLLPKNFFFLLLQDNRYSMMQGE